MSSWAPESDLNEIEPYNPHLVKEKSDIIYSTNPFQLCEEPRYDLSEPILFTANPPKTDFHQHTNSPDITLSCKKKKPIKSMLTPINYTINGNTINEAKDDYSDTKDTLNIKKSASIIDNIPIILRNINNDFAPPIETELESSRRAYCQTKRSCCIVF
jgi:hypothetical protein